MAQNGIRTIDLPPLSGLDSVLGNFEGTTGALNVDALVALVNARSGPAFETLAELNGDLDWGAGTLATVWGEPDDAINGVYQKTGASGAGAWTRIGGLPITALSTALLALKADVADLEALETQVTSIAAGLSPAGNWDPTSGAFPSGAAANTFYVANAAGIVDGQTFAVGDWLIALIAAPSTTTFAANWTRADYSAVVTAAVVESDEVLKTSLNLSYLLDAAAARGNLGLGAAAVLGVNADPDFDVAPTLLAPRSAIKTLAENLLQSQVAAALAAQEVTQFSQNIDGGDGPDVVIASGIPSSASVITIMFANLSSEGNGNAVLRLGDDSSFSSTSYGSASAVMAGATVDQQIDTTGFLIALSSSARLLNGTMTLQKYSNAVGLPRWSASHQLGGAIGVGGNAVVVGAGDAFYNGLLTRLQLVNLAGDNFSSGTLVAVKWR